jgi:hypothetical protein
MNNVIICYWQPGSGGDTVQHLLSLDSKFYTVVQNFDLEDSGRTVASTLPWFKDNFSHEPGKWYWRDWSSKDLDMIFSCPDLLTSKTLIIPTHRRDQAIWLKENIPNSTTLGICYPKNMYLFVLSRWCKKVATSDSSVAEHYQTPLFQTLRKQKLFGAYVLKDQLKFSSSILQEVLPEWDFNLQLENLLLGDVSILKSIGLDINLINSVLCNWIREQKMLYLWQWNINNDLKTALGYNSRAPLSTNLELSLDEYDTILIQHWLSQHHLPKHKLSNLEQADNYFKKINNMQ